MSTARPVISAFFAVALSATIGVAFSANLLTMYLFYEMLSLATYPLVTHHQDRKAKSSGRKYLLYILGGLHWICPACHADNLSFYPVPLILPPKE